MHPAVKSVRVLDNYRLVLQFRNGEEKIFDVAPYLHIGKFAELREPSMFASVVVKFDSIEWANQLDIDPEFLYEQSRAIETT
jgi:hypothetical protein